MQLLRITSVPMRYQFVTEQAKLQQSSDLGGFTVEKQGGTFEMQSQGAKIQIDSSEFWNDLGYKTRGAALEAQSARSRQAGSEAVARYVDFGNQVDQIQHGGASIPDILYSRMMQDATAGSLAMTPLSPMQISWTQPQLNVNYTPVTQSFDWRSAQSSMEFIPGKFSMDITQYPEIHIEYLGKPIYAPPSADPDFQGTA